MKKLALFLLGVLVVGYAGVRLGLAGPFNEICKSLKPLFWGIRPEFINSTCKQIEDSRRAKTTLLCNWKSHSCNLVQSGPETGELKVRVTVDGKPGKNIEVDLWTSSQPGGADESYIIYTDGNGLAWFKGIPPGVYYPGNNLSGFPKEYGDAYLTWEMLPAQVVKGQSQEAVIALTRAGRPLASEGCTLSSPNNKERGSLKINVTAGGSPVRKLEVDVFSAREVPPVCHILTDENGVAAFGNIPVGDYWVGFNSLNFPKELGESAEKGIWIRVLQDKTTEKTIELLPK